MPHSAHVSEAASAQRRQLWQKLILKVTRKDALRAHAAAYRLANGSPWAFHHLTAHHSGRAGDRLDDLPRGFEVAARRAKLPAELRPYDLRHTRITRWVAAGHNLALVAKAAGHASIRMTMRYTHLTDGDLSALVAPKPRQVIDLKAQIAGAG